MEERSASATAAAASASAEDFISDLLNPLMERLDIGDDIASLQSQVKSLQIRLKELELQNTALSSQISNCRCPKLALNCHPSVKSGDDKVMENGKPSTGGDMVSLVSTGGSCEDEKCKPAEEEGGIGAIDGIRNKKSVEILPGCNTRTIRHHSKRYIALKVMYFGQRFYGFASVQVDPTVESEIFKALEKTKLLVGDVKESRYTRCGRTDKGVSSVGQVISLYLRSKYVDIGVDENREEAASEDIREEIDYVKVLNRVLPKDIRVVSWSPAPVDFNARFSCLSREYKYLFWRGSLDILAMEIAGKKFVGEHDFRNFCKMDAANVHNYRRNITSFEISICDERFEDDQLWAITIKGSAFLWHQIRCMVAVLFMIGQGLESPSVIDALLDIGRISRKPQYTMAPELPLMLRSCEFSVLKFTCSSEAEKALQEHLKNEIKSHKLQATIYLEALQSSLSITRDGSPLDHVKKVAHIPLMSRETEPTYEERWVKLKART